MNLKKLQRYLRVNLLGPGPRLIKKNLPGRGLTEVEKHCDGLLQLADERHGSLRVSRGRPGSCSRPLMPNPLAVKHCTGID